MRPRFEIGLDVPAQRVLAQLGEQLRRKDAPVAGVVRSHAADLRMPVASIHVWSPCLQLDVITGEDGAEHLRGRFAPHPSVWMMFMGVYGLLGLVGTLAVMFGVSQWLVGGRPWALLGAPAAVALGAFTYGASFIGQGLGASQMYTLRAFVDDAVDAAREAERDAAADEEPAHAGGEGEVTGAVVEARDGGAGAESSPAVR